MMWQSPFNGFLTDEWWAWIANNYSYLFKSIPVFTYGILKLLAIRHPNVPSDKIVEWMRQVLK